MNSSFSSNVSSSFSKNSGTGQKSNFLKKKINTTKLDKVNLTNSFKNKTSNVSKTIISSGSNFFLSPISNTAPQNSFSCSSNPIFYNGTGIESDPFQICDCKQLQNVSLNLSASYSLVTNINCDISKNWNNNTGFTPIGNLTPGFIGSLEGNGFSISNIFINKTSNVTSYIGIFGKATNASINNISLINSTIIFDGPGVTGGFLGDLIYTNLTNIFINNSLINVTNSYNPYPYFTYNFVGGVFGSFREGNLENISISNSVIDGFSIMIGGIGGQIGGLVTNNYSYYKNLNSNSNLIIGKTNQSSLVLGGEPWPSKIGGVFGSIYSHVGLINVTSDSNTISGSKYVGGIFGASKNQNNRFSGLVSTRNNISGINLVGGIGGYLGDLGRFSLNDAYLVNSYSEDNNIKGNTSVGGLVGENSGALIKNAFSNNDVITGVNEVGGLVGSHNLYNTILDNSYSNSNISGSKFVGGLVGIKNTYNSVINSFSSSNISGVSLFGGIIGY